MTSASTTSPRLEIASDFAPSGDQPSAIAQLVKGLEEGKRNQVLLGVTGSGKTFTMAHVIEQTQRPALIMAHNKTLAAQLYSEMKLFSPTMRWNILSRITIITSPKPILPRRIRSLRKIRINEQIDRMRHSATRAMLERSDVIVVASVCCIYGIGSVETYTGMTHTLKAGSEVVPQQFLRALIELQYKRNDIAFKRGTFRVRGDNIDLFPAHMEDTAWRFQFLWR